MKCILVSHTHWDREWYRTHQDFRSRLVDAVDVLLDLCAADPGYHFLLDGQSIALEDYLEIRPERRGDLERFCREGRIAIGPWYVQPDSLLPSGEAHVRNLLEGRRAGEAVGPVSRAGYTPDSFGHPAQFPQMFAGFGIESFLYWRGNGSELDGLPAEYRWESPDGTAVLACHLPNGYFNAGTGPGSDPANAARRIGKTIQDQAGRARAGAMLLMNGIDHALPEPRTGDLVEAIARETGFAVERGVLEDFLAALEVPGDVPVHRGELVGGRTANLLPGVWSTRSWIKRDNRRCESLLEGWAEPFAAQAARVGLPDERPSLRLAWREVLKNQAHDSICGCSRDEVHQQMVGRYDAARELADATVRRCLERIAGLDAGRTTPWTEAPALAVFNPSPHPRTDVVRFAVDPHPWMAPIDEGVNVPSGVHPLTLKSLAPTGFAVDGRPARVVPSEAGRMALLPDRAGPDVEFVVEDVPAFGWMRVALEPTEPVPDEVDGGDTIAAGDVSVTARADGTLDVAFGERRFEGLAALEDVGDRGDTYDFDLAPGGEVERVSVSRERRRHPSGLQELEIRRELSVPDGLSEDRSERANTRAAVVVTTTARVAPGVERVDLRVRIDNQARDHRLQMLFPTGAPLSDLEAATTFDVARREPGAADAEGWIHPAPDTFPCQGWLAAHGLCVVAPGLNEAAARADGTLAVTLLRSTGYLSRHDLTTRPGPAGPGTETPEAQCLGRLDLELALLPGGDPARARDAELGLRTVTAGDAPKLAAGEARVALEGDGLVLSALKPAEDGDGIVVRVLNPGDAPREARLWVALPFETARAVRLDEADVAEPLERDGDTLRFPVPPHALRSVRLS